MKKKSIRFLFVSLVLCIISWVGASFVQTSGGDIKVKDLRWETSSGHLMSALLFIPETATKDHPAPAIVTSHGWYNNREMQDMNYVEYARRGYVVMSIDMYGHGNSDVVSASEWQNAGTGMYDAVKLIADLPYVDSTQIGVTGHSNGARAANWSINEDNKAEQPLIDAALLVANDPMYTSNPAEPLYWGLQPKEKEYANVYGNRDVGVVAARYDEFFFRSIAEDGTVTKPRDYIHTPNAQSFLNFGVDPSGAEERSSYKIYKQEIDGKEASRVIYNPAQDHPWNTISKSVATSSIQFFEDALPAPNPIPASHQVWQWKAFFNLVGLVGFAMFIVAVTKFLLFTSPFSSLRAQEKVMATTAPSGGGQLWFWGGLIVSAIVSGYCYLKLFNWSNAHIPSSYFTQYPTFYIGIWCLVTGVFAIILMIVSYQFYSKKHGVNLRENGVIINIKKLMKTIVLAITVSFAAFLLVFIGDYLFKSDFRFWVLAVKAFTPDKLIIALKYLPFFLLFYVVNSVAINCFNYVKIGNKEWLNTAILALFNSLGIIVIVGIQYITFFTKGDVFFTNVSTIIEIWLFPIIVILIVAAIISRKIYRVTNNPYLAGFINAIIITIITVTNTLTQF